MRIVEKRGFILAFLMTEVKQCGSMPRVRPTIRPDPFMCIVIS
jgi:hypothetical protein